MDALVSEIVFAAHEGYASDNLPVAVARNMRTKTEKERESVRRPVHLYLTFASTRPPRFG